MYFGAAHCCRRGGVEITEVVVVDLQLPLLDFLLQVLQLLDLLLLVLLTVAMLVMLMVLLV